MMKYELENFMKPFFGEIELIIKLDGDEQPTLVIGAEYHIDSGGNGHVKLVPASILTRQTKEVIGYTKTGPGGELERVKIVNTDTKTVNTDILKELINFIENNNVEDEGSDDGDGHYDTWRSYEFELLIKKAKEVIEC